MINMFRREGDGSEMMLTSLSFQWHWQENGSSGSQECGEKRNPQSLLAEMWLSRDNAQIGMEVTKKKLRIELERKLSGEIGWKTPYINFGLYMNMHLASLIAYNSSSRIFLNLELNTFLSKMIKFNCLLFSRIWIEFMNYFLSLS